MGPVFLLATSTLAVLGWRILHQVEARPSPEALAGAGWQEAGWTLLALSGLIWGIHHTFRRSVLDPLRLMADVVSRRSASDRPERIPSLGDDEVGYLAERLQQAFDELAAKTAEAEGLSMVARKTSNAAVITDAEQRIAWVNEAFSRIHGYTLAEMRGRTLVDFLNEQAVGGLGAQAHDRLQQALVRREGCRQEMPVRRRDGQILWLDVELQPLPEKRGERTGFMVMQADVTERKRAERALRLTQFAIDHCSDAALWVLSDGRIYYANEAAARAVGCSTEELLQTSVCDLFSCGQPGGVLMYWPELVDGRAKVFECALRARDGREIPVEVQANHVRFEAEEFRCFFLRDLTQRKEAERERSLEEIQIRHSQRLESMGRLAAGIAHELNTPIQYIGDNVGFLDETFRKLERVGKLHAQVIAAAKAQPDLLPLVREVESAWEEVDGEFLLPEIPAAIAGTLDGVARVAKIVRAMKDFSHPGTSGKSSLDLNKAVENTLIVSRNEWKYHAQLITHFDPDLPPVLGLPDELNQAVLNLIVNAAHAMADRHRTETSTIGTLTVSTRRDGEWAELRIGDTGVGIPDPIRSKIFEPFFTTKEVGRGTGQGLAIVRSVIVEKHGGRIDFETEVGAGTTFIVRLPINEPVREQAA